jgi:transposase
MNIHANAKTCPNSRELLARRVIERGWSYSQAAEAAGISVRTAAKWISRYRRGEPMTDRSSAPRRIPLRTDRARVEAIEQLRRLRMTAAEIAEILGMALSAVSRWLKRIGLGKRSRLEPLEPPNRYQRSRPGELIHVDVKKLGRFERAGHRATGSRRGRRTQTTAAGRGRGVVGWEFCQVTIDDATGLPSSRCCPMSARRRRSASCDGQSPGLPSAVFGSSG